MKQTGIGDRLLVAGYDISGDVGAVSRIGSSSEVLDVTAISAAARERVYGIADGEISFSAFWNAAPAGEHQVLRAKGAGRIVTYLRGTGLGAPAACMDAAQVSYDLTREAGGALTASIQCLARERAIDWGVQLTPGGRTDASAASGAGVDNGQSTATGWAAYLHVLALGSGAPTVVIEQSDDGGGSDPWAALPGATFTGLAAGNAYLLRSASLTAPVKRWLRVVSSGTFSGLTYVVAFSRSPVEV